MVKDLIAELSLCVMFGRDLIGELKLICISYLFIYLVFYVTPGTLSVILTGRRRTEETSPYSWSSFCTIKVIMLEKPSFASVQCFPLSINGLYSGGSVCTFMHGKGNITHKKINIGLYFPYISMR